MSGCVFPTSSDPTGPGTDTEVDGSEGEASSQGPDSADSTTGEELSSLGLYLSANPNVQESLCFRFTADTCTHYPDMDEVHQQSLDEAFEAAMDLSEPLTFPSFVNLAEDEVQENPEGDPVTVVSQDQAWQVFRNSLMTTLALDEVNEFSWDLESYSHEQLTLILNSDRFFEVTDLGYQFRRWTLPTSPAEIMTLALDWISATRAQTVANITEYVGETFVHITGPISAEGYHRTYGVWGLPTFSQLWIEGRRKGELQATMPGCHGSTSLMYDLFAFLGIPSEREIVGGHSTMRFHDQVNGVWVRPGLTHGDDPYTDMGSFLTPFDYSLLWIPSETYDLWFADSNTYRQDYVAKGARHAQIYQPSTQLLGRVCEDMENGFWREEDLFVHPKIDLDPSNQVFGFFRLHSAGTPEYLLGMTVYSYDELEGLDFFNRMEEVLQTQASCDQLPAPKGPIKAALTTRECTLINRLSPRLVQK